MYIKRSVKLIQRSCIKGAQGISEFKNPTQGNNKKGENQMYVEHDEFDREILVAYDANSDTFFIASLWYNNYDM